MTETVLLFIAGGLLLVVGAEALVRGASRLALTFGISPLVVGLTVVAFGTSAPELAVSVGAGLGGQASIALGNVIGSNIFNVLLILGISALVAPLVVAVRLIRREVPLMIGLSILTLLFALDGAISRLDGILFFSGIIAYTVLLVRESRRDGQTRLDNSGDTVVVEAPSSQTWKNILLIITGLAVLVLGADFLVVSASSIATALGMSDLVIGLTVVAAGTSLPELATSVIAAIRGERDIAVGNIIGSNIFNILGVLGATSMITGSIDVPQGILTFDLPVMIAVSIAVLPILFSNLQISRWEGFIFVLYYVFYTVHLILVATTHTLLDEFSYAMTWFVLPLTVLTILVITVQAIQDRRGHGV